MNTQLTIDFKAVSHAKFYYRTQLGVTARVLPRVPTVNGFPVTALQLVRPEQRAKLDVWTPCITLQLRNNHSLRFKGDKAKQMWKAYNKHIYG